jgi:hypothetical protein
MVKKACNKYQTSVRDCWSFAAAAEDEDREEAPAGPVSPTEGCVAPPSPGAYYRPLTAITTQHSKYCNLPSSVAQPVLTVSTLWGRSSSKYNFKNSIRTSKKTQHFAITEINSLMLFRKIIPFLHRESYKTHTYKTEHY